MEATPADAKTAIPSLARFDVALFWNSAPKGKQHASPGQRPGNRDSKKGNALKGRHNSRLLRARSPPENRILYRTFSARAWLLDVIPGRCPGLICDCPFGATTQ
jgi:hypothetical protein